MQRRNFHRLRINSEARILTREGSFPGTLENISLSGMYVRAAEKVKQGDFIEIVIPLPSVTSSTSLQIRGGVVRVDEDGIAVRIGTIDHATFTHLRAILKNKAVRKLAA